MIPHVSTVEERAAIIGPWAIVADLHVGYEASMVREGAMVPRVQTSEMIHKLREIRKKYDAGNLIVCGDLKHSFGPKMSLEWDEVKTMLAAMSRIFDEVHIIRGNHDNYLLSIIKKEGFDDIVWHEMYFDIDYEGFRARVFHGHKAVELLHGQRVVNIMGHEHPAIIYSGEFGASTSYPAFVDIRALNILVLPAFSPLMTGANILEFNFLSPVLNSNIDKIKSGIKIYAFIDGTLHSFP